MTTSSKRKPAPGAANDDAQVVAKLMDGHYDRLLAAFEEQLEEAAAALRRCHAAMKAENTLVS